MSYLEKHNASGFEVGDRVRILRDSYEGEDGWEDVWNVLMNDHIGGVGKIVGDQETWGFVVLCDNTDEEWNFPYFVLEKVEE